ncbi:low temperature requirement protein A [Phytoactinopolyspora halotolerans]|uniref:Low temperature requirement protein A n=1 Tax=Phytoactinopolyspora halotolerans TaxID=1981512 RepID=A0A6L9SET7_9ACTN|nr:low temperature requirement protein A [Phytoactinopolyspora halotolerans]
MRSTADDNPPVGAVELFFDLVYVLTIIQLSHYLLYDLSWQGAAETAVLFLAVWWGWNYTAWAMNWLDPEHAGVRGLLVVLMLAALGMAIAIPDAFGGRAALFAAAYVIFQLIRSAFMVAAFRGQVMGRNYAQLLAWSGFAGVFWIAGAFVPDDAQLVVWALAVLIDYVAPLVGFWLPGVGGTDMADWPLAEEHLAERNRLVFIIALGESILILGTLLSEIELSSSVVAAAVVGFATIVLLWWLYFSRRLGNAEHDAPERSEATAMARGAYAYAHALMVGGAIVVAVGIEQITHHPLEDAEWSMAGTVLGGPVLYLVGNVIFNAARTGVVPRSRLAALVALAVLVPFVPAMSALVLGIAALVVLAALAVVTGEIRTSTEPRAEQGAGQEAIGR